MSDARTPSTPTSARRTALDAPAVILLVTICLLFGVNQVATKVALSDIPPLWQAAARSLGAAVLLLGWMRWRGLAVWQRDGSSAPGVLAGLLFAGEFACIFIGLQYTSASRMVVFLYTAPFVVALGMPFVARSERLSTPQAAGLVLAFCGVMWALGESLGAAPASPTQWLGDSLGVAAAVLWGVTTLVVRGSALATVSAEKALLYQLVVSMVALAAAAGWAGEAWPARIGTLALGSLAFQTIVITFACYLTWFWLVRHYPATQVAAFTLLTPIFGLAAGVVLLGEPLTPRLVTALVAVVAGLWLVNRPRSPARR